MTACEREREFSHGQRCVTLAVETVQRVNSDVHPPHHVVAVL